MWMEENFCLIHLSGSMRHMFGGGMHCSCGRYWKNWLAWWILTCKHHWQMHAIIGCGHEFCTKCALYLCSSTSSSTSIRGVPGSISCPFCRHAIVSFMKLTSTTPIKELPWTGTSLALCAAGASTGPDRGSSLHRRPEMRRLRSSSVDLGCSSFRSIGSGKLSSLKLNCTGVEEAVPCLVSCLRPDVQRSSSYRERIRRYSEFWKDPLILCLPSCEFSGFGSSNLCSVC